MNMDNNKMMSLEINEDMVRPILETQIQAAIVSQLGDQDKLIEAIVKKALSEKVDSDGKRDKYDSYNKHDYLEVLASKSIRTAAKDALAEWLETNSHKVKTAVLKELETPSRQRSIAVAYADAIETSLKCSWTMGCNISFERKED